MPRKPSQGTSMSHGEYNEYSDESNVYLIKSPAEENSTYNILIS